MWTVTSAESELLISMIYQETDSLGDVTSHNNFTVTLSNKYYSRLTSKFNFTFSKDVNVVCADNMETKTKTLHTASKQL